MTLESTIQDIGPLDTDAMQAARQRQQELTKPPGSLGRLEELSIQIAGILGSARPNIGGKIIVVACADHGVVSEGVSGYPQEVTAQMVQNFLAGGAAISVMARRAGTSLVIVDAGMAIALPAHDDLRAVRIGPGTANMARGPAMSTAQAQEAIEAGIQIADEAASAGVNLIGLGDMGIGNTTAAAAITSVLCDVPAFQTTGRGTGRNNAELAANVDVVERAIRVNRPDPANGLAVLARVGGFEIGVLVGVILGAAANVQVVVLDGFITAAAALIAQKLCPAATEYLVASHLSAEQGHQVALSQLRLKPLLELQLRLGEGTGAALAMGLIEAAAACLSEMATFEDANVSDAKDSSVR